MKRILLLLVPVLLVPATAVPAQAVAPDVEAFSFGYTPVPYVSDPGETIVFVQSGADTHTATQDKPFHLWNTGDLNASPGFHTVDADWAGTFKYHCRYHSTMHGVLRTPVDTSPSAGALGDPFQVGGGAADAPTGMKYEMQIRRNGGTWAKFKTTRNSPVPFVPTRPGTYDFRSRVLHLAKDVHTGWSPLNPAFSQIVVS